MNFQMVHFNFNVLDLKKSMDFYAEALDLHEARRIVPPDGSFIIVYLEDHTHTFQLELTWLKDRTESYDLGESEFHLAFVTDDFAAARARHEKMGCIAFENKNMGIYFITDPDGYWLEVIPAKKTN